MIPRFTETGGCAIAGCEVKPGRRGLCQRHYIKAWKSGDVVALTDDERFWIKVQAEPGQCWTWVGTVLSQGYGQFVVKGQKRALAHRHAWTLLVGPIPDGMQLDHLCRNTLCVNPDHLEPVDGRTNILRSYAPSALNARKKLCCRGHDAWVPDWRGDRMCIECRRIRDRNRNKAAA